MTLHRELVNLEPKLSELFSTWDPPAVSPGPGFWVEGMWRRSQMDWGWGVS